MKHFPVLFLMLFSIIVYAHSAKAQTVPNVCHAQLFLADFNNAGRLVTSGNNLVFIEDLPAAGWFQASPPGQSQALIIDRSIIIDVNAQPNVVNALTVSIQTKQIVNYQARREKFITFRFLSGNCPPIVTWLGRRNSLPPKGPSKPPPFREVVIPASHRRNMRPDVSGELVIWEKMITFGNRRGSTYRWDFRDIRDIERRGSYFLEITPFSGSKFTFTLYGRGLNQTDFNALLDRIRRQ